jgi:hypothetical protein
MRLQQYNSLSNNTLKEGSQVSTYGKTAGRSVLVIIGQTIVVDGGTTSLMSLIFDFRNESQARFGTGYLFGV